MAPVSKPKVKVAPERAGTTKIWNISDWSATSVSMQSVVVMGSTIPPGGVLAVPESVLKNAHKTWKARDAGLIHIGNEPPAGYQRDMARKQRLRVPGGAVRAHGAQNPEASAAKKPIESKGPAKLEVKEPVSMEPKVEKVLEKEDKKGKR